MKKLIILFVFFQYSLFSFSNSNNNIISFIGEKNYLEIKDKGEISVVLKGKESPTLLPSLLEKEIIYNKIENLNPTIGVELLSLINIKENENREKDPLSIYNILRAISTLKGTMYYSASRKKDHILYRDAYIIDSPETKNPREDPLFQSVPFHSDAFAYFIDSSLGEYSCYIEYLYNNNSFIISIENVSPIRYVFIPIVQPYGLLSCFIIRPYEEEIVFYGFSCLKTNTLLGKQEGKVDSLYNRIKAFYHWFQTHYMEIPYE